MPDKLKDNLVDSTIGDTILPTRKQTKIYLLHTVIDSVLLEINNRFSNTNIDILCSVSSLSL